MKILAINPGSTSTKEIALYEDRELLFKESVEHSSEELEKYPTIASVFYEKRPYNRYAIKGMDCSRGRYAKRSSWKGDFFRRLNQVPMR